MSLGVLIAIFAILSGAGLVGASVWRKRSQRELGAPTPTALLADPEAESYEDVELSKARRGDTIVVKDAGENYEDLSFVVKRIHRYEAEGYSWYELVGKSPQGKVGLEWELDEDELSVSLSVPPQRRIEELSLTPDDLRRMDREKVTSNTITFEGKVFRYEESHEALYYEDSKGRPEEFYLWDFVADDGGAIGVEKWEDEPFEVHVSKPIDPQDVSIYRGGRR